MSALRPLPPQPSLEFERKEAKALLPRLRTGDAEALERARARHPAIAAKSPADIRLADAQLVIAREYGFTSWPRLVRYFTELPAGQQGQTPRQFAQGMFEHFPDNADARRIVELCGLDPEAILSASNARPLPSPSVQPKLQEALELAGDDAFRLGQSEIGVENLLFGLLRRGGMPQIYYADVSQMDKERFYQDWHERLLPVTERLERPKLPMAVEARAAIEDAIALGAQRRRDTIHGLHLLYALTRSANTVAIDLLQRYDANITTFMEALQREANA